MEIKEMSNQQFAKQQIKKIKTLFENIEVELNKIDIKQQNTILNLHNEGFTLQHCIRWGNIVAKEILDYYKEKLNKLNQDLN